MSLNPLDRDAVARYAADLGKNTLFHGADTTVTLPTGDVLSGDDMNALLDVLSPYPAGTDRPISFRVKGPFVLPFD